MSREKQPKQAGFTVLELLVATTVFSTVLLLMTFGIIQIGRIYYKGITSGTTQEAARNIMDTVSRDIQFSGGEVFIPAAPPAPGDLTHPGYVGHYCIGNHRYSFILDRQLNPNPGGDRTPHGLPVDEVSACTTAGPQSLSGALTSGSRELLGFQMRLSKFSIINKGDGLYEVTVRVVYGDPDLLNGVHTNCIGGPGSAFCASSELTTTVKKRVSSS